MSFRLSRSHKEKKSLATQTNLSAESTKELTEYQEIIF